MIGFILQEAWPYIAAVGAGVLAFIFGWSARKNKDQAKQAKQQIEGMKNAIAARDEISDMDDDAVRRAALGRMQQSTKK